MANKRQRKKRRTISRDKKARLFKLMSEDSAQNGLSTKRAAAVICPLCWHEKSFDEMTGEHVVPFSVGGTSELLTCKTCNNSQGSSLDAHLQRYQFWADGFSGHGAIPATLSLGDHAVTVEVDWKDGRKEIRVIGEASNPAAAKAIVDSLRDQTAKELNLHFWFGYTKNRFQTALLRAAYLVTFDLLGYQYVKTDVAQCIRRRIADLKLDEPELATLIMELRNFTGDHDKQDLWVECMRDGVAYFMVFIRARIKSSTHFAVLLPSRAGQWHEFQRLARQLKDVYHGKTMTISGDYFSTTQKHRNEFIP